jgi:hypothetical protein
MFPMEQRGPFCGVRLWLGVMPVTDGHILASIASESVDQSLSGGGKMIFPHYNYIGKYYRAYVAENVCQLGVAVLEVMPVNNGHRLPLSGIQSESGLWNWRIFFSIFDNHGLPCFGLCADDANFTYVLIFEWQHTCIF